MLVHKHAFYCFFQDQLGTMARAVKETVAKYNVKEKLKTAAGYLSKLHHLSQVNNVCCKKFQIYCFNL